MGMDEDKSVGETFFMQVNVGKCVLALWWEFKFL